MSIINAGEVYHVDASKYLRGYEDTRITSIQVNASAGTKVHPQERMQQGSKEEDTAVPVPVNSEECNGWRNYETWKVYLYISGLEGMIPWLIEEGKEDAKGIADRLKEYLIDTSTDIFPVSVLIHELAMMSIERVDYRAIALFLLDEARIKKEQMI